MHVKEGSSHRASSLLWNHFTKNQDGKSAICHYCKAKVSLSGSTGNLKRHMVSKHPTVSLERHNVAASTSRERSRSPLNSDAEKVWIEEVEQGESEKLADSLSQSKIEPLDIRDPTITVEGAQNTGGAETFCQPYTIITKKKKKEVASSKVNMALKDLQQASQAFQSMTTRQIPQQSDCYALYGQLVAERLKSLSPRARLLVQNKIDNLLCEAILSEMDRNLSNTSPTPTSTPSPTFVYV